jgi:alpha-glucosidase
VADESKDSNSVLEFYKTVLKLRHKNRALLDGNYTALNESDANVFSYLRVYKDRGVVVTLNMSDTPQNVKLELKGKGVASAKSLLATGKSGAKGDEVSLEPYGVFIGELRK